MAGGGKQTPRQRLINLMYLVLTAMLALQVSSSIMDKFIFLNESLEHSKKESVLASEAALEALKKKVKTEGNSPEGLASIKRGEDLKKKTAEVVSDIEKIKDMLIQKVGGGIDPHTRSIKTPKEETGVETNMIGTNKNGKGYEIEKRLNGYVDYLKTTFKDLGLPNLEPLALGNEKVAIYKEDPIQRNKDFANANFGQTPVVAALAILTQKQTEVIRYEQEVLKKLGAGDLSRDVKFDKIIAMASADANIVAAGQDYTAKMFISATSSGAGSRMSSDAGGVKVDGDGVGELKFTASGTGKKTWNGSITIKSRGKDTTFTLKKEYEVVQPVLIVNAKSKFPLYQECANPLETSVPALGPAYKPSFSVNNGTLTPGSRLGDVIIFPTTLGLCKLSVSSSGRSVGETEFRVNPVPPPSVFLANNAGGAINYKDPLPAGNFKIAAKSDETFQNTLPDEAKYRVCGVSVTIFRGGRSAGSVKSGDGSVNLASMNTRPGDGVQVTIECVQRINSQNKILPVTINQPYVSFFLK